MMCFKDPFNGAELISRQVAVVVVQEERRLELPTLVTLRNHGTDNLGLGFSHGTSGCFEESANQKSWITTRKILLPFHLRLPIPGFHSCVCFFLSLPFFFSSPKGLSPRCLPQ